MVALNERGDEVTVVCRSCRVPHSLLVSISDLHSWKVQGKYIQDAMPYLSADERELLISQTCGVCWDEMFGECE